VIFWERFFKGMLNVFKINNWFSKIHWFVDFYMVIFFLREKSGDSRGKFVVAG
jgi:hypothetical protein